MDGVVILGVTFQLFLGSNTLSHPHTPINKTLTIKQIIIPTVQKGIQVKYKDIL